MHCIKISELFVLLFICLYAWFFIYDGCYTFLFPVFKVVCVKAAKDFPKDLLQYFDPVQVEDKVAYVTEYHIDHPHPKTCKNSGTCEVTRKGPSCMYVLSFNYILYEFFSSSLTKRGTSLGDVVKDLDWKGLSPYVSTATLNKNICQMTSLNTEVYFCVINIKVHWHHSDRIKYFMWSRNIGARPVQAAGMV